MKSYAQIIIKTSLKTIAFIICVVVMVSLFVFSLFPSLAVEFYSMIGQKNKVSVIKLVAKGTIEEKILELQQLLFLV